jgi:hypothetical protein
MQKKQLLPILLLMLLINACSDSFLKETPTITFTSSDTIYIDRANDTQTTELQINTLADYSFTILQYPNFIKPASFRGRFIEGSTNFTFTSTENIDYLRTYGNIKGMLVLLLENNEAVAFPLKIPGLFENPGEMEQYELTIQPSTLDFGTTTAINVQIINSGTNQLSWSIVSMPDWLSVNLTQGELTPYGTGSLVFTANREGKSNGIYHGYVTIMIDGNPSATKEMYASMEVNSQQPVLETTTIDGFVVAARYLKTTDQLLLLTQSPNQLGIINMINGNRQNIDLPKKPTGMAISDDETMALISYTVAEVSHIDLINKQLKNNFELPFIPFGMTIGENGWCYLTTSSFENYRHTLSLNVNDGYIHRNVFNYAIMNMTSVHKIPGHQKLIFIPANSSPSHFKLGNIENDTISGNYIENNSFSSGGSIWFLKNGTQVLSATKEIFKLNLTTNDHHFISRYGTIEDQFSTIHWADECEQTNQAILTVSQGYSSPAGDSYASVWDLDSYSEVKKIKPGIINNKVLYVYFSFLDSKGLEAYLIVRDDLNPYTTDGQWYLLKY